MAVLGSTLNDVSTLNRHREWFMSLSGLSVYSKQKNHYLFDCELTNFRKFYIDFLGRIGMAKKSVSSNKYSFKGFANINISVEHADAVEKYCADNEQVWQHYIFALNEDMSIKTVYDSKNAAYRVTMTCMDMSSENGGLSMSSFADDPFMALGVAMYKHFVIAEREWANFVGTDNRKFG